MSSRERTPPLREAQAARGVQPRQARGLLLHRRACGGSALARTGRWEAPATSDAERPLGVRDLLRGRPRNDADRREARDDRRRADADMRGCERNQPPPCPGGTACIEALEVVAPGRDDDATALTRGRRAEHLERRESRVHLRGGVRTNGERRMDHVAEERRLRRDRRRDLHAGGSCARRPDEHEERSESHRPSSYATRRNVRRRRSAHERNARWMPSIGVTQRHRVHPRPAEPPNELGVALLVRSPQRIRLAPRQPRSSQSACLGIDEREHNTGDVREAALPGRILHHDRNDVATQAAQTGPRSVSERPEEVGNQKHRSCRAAAACVAVRAP